MTRAFDVRISPLLAALLIVVATNVVALGNVWLNRYGEPDSTLVLTERELRLWPMNGSGSTDTGSQVHLTWRVLRVQTPEGESESPIAGAGWPQAVELRKLGFDVPDDLDALEGWLRVDGQTRRMYLVLELDGSAYRDQLAQALARVHQAAEALIAAPADERARWSWDGAQRDYEQEAREATRLFVVDAGLDPQRLRLRYADRDQYAIVEGRVRLWTMSQRGSRRISARVEDLTIGAIETPHTFREILKHTAYHQPLGRGPRYAGTVNFGNRFEPWITDMLLLPQNATAVSADDPPPLAPVEVQD